jgi:hypothetical protein
MNPFAHFVLTRFNAPAAAAPAAKAPDAKPGAEAGNLARRFDWFERVCLASMDRQTEGAFHWLVFMDWATPVPFKERMAALAVHYDFLRPIYCSIFQEALVLEEIRRHETPACVRITTALDVAAALHPRMIEHVQELARANMAVLDLQKGFFIRFPVGCCERQGDFYIRRDLFNPFASFASAPGCDRTVLSADPGLPVGGLPVVAPAMRPMWCQVADPDLDPLPVTGVYWPWGGCSEFAPVVTKGFCRGGLWQTAEVLRSAARALRARGARGEP